jgi:hypothetical protein
MRICADLPLSLDVDSVGAGEAVEAVGPSLAEGP